MLASDCICFKYDPKGPAVNSTDAHHGFCTGPWAKKLKGDQTHLKYGKDTATPLMDL